MKRILLGVEIVSRILSHPVQWVEVIKENIVEIEVLLEFHCIGEV